MGALREHVLLRVVGISVVCWNCHGFGSCPVVVCGQLLLQIRRMAYNNKIV